MKSSQNSTFNNGLSCLHYNEQLNKLISETISNIDRNIESLKDSQDYLFSQVKKEDQIRGSYVMQFINSQNAGFIRTPFFITNMGLTPPTSEIEKCKVSSGSFNFYDLKRKLLKICSQKDLELLKDAIGKNVYDIEIERFANSSEKTKAKELQAISTMSFDSLSSKCDSLMMNKIDWLGISVQNLKGRLTAENCRKIWEQNLNPEFPVPKWTEAQCQELLNLTSEIGAQGEWTKIASRMSFKIPPHRCFKKWLELTSKMETSDEWSSDEDAYLSEIVNNIAERDEHNKNVNWNKVALMVPNRSARDCEKRWNSLQLPINNRRFSDDEDYQLLLLIKRMGVEHWGDIAREMDKRTPEQCQQRYCEIVEDLHPWTYLEDRQLWLCLRPHFKELWSGNERIEEMTKDLSLYTTAVNYCSGRCPLVIRHRFLKLCKWFSLWNRFYLCLNSKESKNTSLDCQTTSLLSQICPEKTAILTKIINIILKTSFFDALRKALRENGSKNPDSDADELIMHCKNGNSELLKRLIKESTDQNLMEHLLFIVDLQNGIFIPRQFEKYIHRTNSSLKCPEKADSDLRCLSSNVRTYEIKTAIVNTLKKRLHELVTDSDITDHDKMCIEKLLNCEGKFIGSLNFAVDSLARTHDFHFVIKVDLLEKVLPRILKLMVQYIYDQENNELTKKSLSVRFNNQFASKREQIAELLIYRQFLPDIYKTYPSQKKSTCFISRNVPSAIAKNMLKENKIEMNAHKVYEIVSSQQQETLLDNSTFLPNENFSNLLKNIKLMTPNRCTLHLLRAFFLQKQDLINSSAEEFSRIVRLKYDHPVNYLNADESLMRENPMEIDSESTDLSDKKYLLLKTRIMSLLAIPSLVARISPFTAALAADRLHEAQNNVKYSNNISKSFNSVDRSRASGSSMSGGQTSDSRSKGAKRKILECLDESEVFEVKTEKQPEIINVNHHPHTRSVAQNWISIYLPDSKRNVFVSKDIFHPFITSNFTIDSINGIKVADFMDE